ncbi:MAG: zinc ribbon domain-containing protein [candidate division WOR-3 bacterium]
MYCPNCGAQTLPEQRFCRRCGIDLRLISQAVGDQGFETPAPQDWHSRFQILVDVVHESLQKGVGFLKNEIHELQVSDKKVPLMKLGLWAFWAGIAAALLGRVNGIILFVIGLGMMAYSRGFFRSTRAGTSQASAATSRQSYYAGGQTPSIQSQESLNLNPSVAEAPYPPQMDESATVKLEAPDYVPPKREAER